MSRLFIAAITCLSLAGGAALAQTTSTMSDNMGNTSGNSMSNSSGSAMGNSMSHDTMGNNSMGNGNGSSGSMGHSTNQ